MILATAWMSCQQTSDALSSVGVYHYQGICLALEIIYILIIMSCSRHYILTRENKVLDLPLLPDLSLRMGQVMGSRLTLCSVLLTEPWCTAGGTITKECLLSWQKTNIVPDLHFPLDLSFHQRQIVGSVHVLQAQLIVLFLHFMALSWAHRQHCWICFVWPRAPRLWWPFFLYLLLILQHLYSLNSLFRSSDEKQLEMTWC